MNNSTNCRRQDELKGIIEHAFFPLYSMMFTLSVILNSLLLYVVTKKIPFAHEKKTFHRLFQYLIIFDLVISILILPNILIKAFTDDKDTHVMIDIFLAIRDFTITVQMFILVLMAIDRLLAYLTPVNNFWRLENVIKIIKTLMVIAGILYLVRLILLNIEISCTMKVNIDGQAKDVIGISGGFFMLINLLIYIILFAFLCRRHVSHQKQSLSSSGYKSPGPTPHSSEYREGKIFTSNSSNDSKFSRMALKNLSYRFNITSIKFARVLLGVNVLMITSFLPAVLYNGKIIEFPTFSVYYLFFLHALGDPILFFTTQQELKDGLISIFKFNKLNCRIFIPKCVNKE